MKEIIRDVVCIGSAAIFFSFIDDNARGVIVGGIILFTGLILLLVTLVLKRRTKEMINCTIHTMKESFTTRYGISSESYTWPAHKVDVEGHPEMDLIVYQSRSGWIVHDRLSGRSYGRIKAGVGWYGFSTPDEAVKAYIVEIFNESKIQEKS